MKKDSDLLTSGEMAQFCGTTKATLRHYANEHLLMPSTVGENGYHYYRVNDSYRFQAIQILQEQGMTLNEIKEYLEHRSYDSFMELLEMLADRMDYSIKRIQWEREVVSNTIEHLRELNPEQEQLRVPQIMTFPETNYLITPYENNVAQALNLHNKARLQDMGKMDIFISGMVVEKDYLSGSVENSYLCTKIGKRKNVSNTFYQFLTRPAGEYAVVRLRYGEWSRAKGLTALMSYIRAKKYAPTGPLIIDEMVDPYTNKDHNLSLYTMSVQVVKEQTP